MTRWSTKLMLTSSIGKVEKANGRNKSLTPFGPLELCNMLTLSTIKFVNNIIQMDGWHMDAESKGRRCLHYLEEEVGSISGNWLKWSHNWAYLFAYELLLSLPFCDSTVHSHLACLAESPTGRWHRRELNWPSAPSPRRGRFVVVCVLIGCQGGLDGRIDKYKYENSKSVSCICSLYVS